MDFTVALKGNEFVLVQATVMPRETPLCDAHDPDARPSRFLRAQQSWGLARPNAPFEGFLSEWLGSLREEFLSEAHSPAPEQPAISTR